MMGKMIVAFPVFIIVLALTPTDWGVVANPATNACGLTLPFRSGTPYTIGDRFDTSNASRHHVGTDLLVERNGIEVVAPESGRIIWLGPDPNGGWGMDVKTVCGWGYGVFHFAPANGLKVGMDITRGQYIGSVAFPQRPHVHIDVKIWEDNGLYFVDSFPQSGRDCARWKFQRQGASLLINGPCSPGYWLGGEPSYP